MIISEGLDRGELRREEWTGLKSHAFALDSKKLQTVALTHQCMITNKVLK